MLSDVSTHRNIFLLDSNSFIHQMGLDVFDRAVTVLVKHTFHPFNGPKQIHGCRTGRREMIANLQNRSPKLPMIRTLNRLSPKCDAHSSRHTNRRRSPHAQFSNRIGHGQIVMTVENVHPPGQLALVKQTNHTVFPLNCRNHVSDPSF